MINWWHWDMEAPPVGWFLLDFGLFIGLLVYFTRTPLRKAFAARHAAIKSLIEANDAAYASARVEYESARDKLAAVEREAMQLIARIREDGVVARDRIVESARTFAARLREDVQGIVAHETNAAQGRLRRVTAEQVLVLAEQALVAAITDADRSRMIDDAVNEIEKVESLAVAQRQRRSGGSAAGGNVAGGAS